MFNALFFTSFLFCILSECLGTTSDFHLSVKPFKSFIKQDVLKSTFLNFRKRLNLIIEAKCGNVEPKKNFFSTV